MNYDEHIYHLQVAIIGEQPDDIVQFAKDQLNADHVELVKDQLFPHEVSEDGCNES